MNPSTPSISLYLPSFPLVMREIRVFLRSNKAFLCMFLFLGALVWIVYMNWATFAAYWQPNQDLSIGARNFFYALARGHLFLILFLVPVLFAPSIVEEREKQTLELLISSPIAAHQMVIAKMITPLLYMILLLTGALPILSLCFLGGGLGMEEVGFTYLLFISTTIQYSCLVLFCSTLRPRIYEVYLIATLMILIWSLLIPYHGSVWNFISEVRWKEGSSINHGMQLTSPFFVLRGVIYSTASTDRGNLVFVYVAQSIALSGVFLLATFALVRRIASGQTFQESWGGDEEEDLLLKNERDYTITFDLTSQEGNPGLILEQKVQWFAKLPVLLRLFYSALMLSVLTLPLASYQGSWLFLSLPFISAAFFTLPLAATSISSDFERETLNLLRTTLLSSRQIIQAKFIACMQYSFIIALALYLPGMLIQLLCGFLGYEVDLATNRMDTLAIIFYPFVLFVSLVMYTAWGLFCSAFFKQSNRSLLVAGVLILGTLSAPFLVPQIQNYAFSTFSYFLTYFLMFMSPLAGIATLFPAGSIRYLERSLTMSYGFTFGQCIFFCFITYFFLKRAVCALERQD